MNKNDPLKFRGENAQYLTQGLFWEYRHQSSSDTYHYNLGEFDLKDSKSMYKIYMACDSEYEAAMVLLGSWKHWERLSECQWFKEHLTKWREEREIREAALGKKVLVDQAEEGNVPAAKALLDLSGKRKAGRPSKIEVTEEREKQARLNSKVSSLVERMSKK